MRLYGLVQYVKETGEEVAIFMDGHEQFYAGLYDATSDTWKFNEINFPDGDHLGEVPTVGVNWSKERI